MTNLPSDDNFIGRARYAKGRDTLKAIHDATYDIIVSKGLSAASQEAIASRANVSQSTVRHYFPTKAELLLAFFSLNPGTNLIFLRLGSYGFPQTR